MTLLHLERWNQRISHLKGAYILKWNATVTMNRAPMINQNITFHLPKYNSNMFCVLKVITDKLTLLCLTMYSAIFLQSLLWDLNQMTSHVHTRREGGRGGWGRRKFYLRVELIKCIDPNEGEALKRGGRGRGGRGQAGGREGRVGGGWKGGKCYLGGWNWSNVLIQMKVRHWGGGPPSNLGVWRPLWGRGREGGRREGGYRLIISVSWLSTTETHAHVTSHFRWPG